MNWHVYIVLCTDGSLYTGITTDIERRLGQHRKGTGAKYFRGHRLKQLVYQESGHDRGSASRREAQIKKLRSEDKWRLIELSRNGLE